MKSLKALKALAEKHGGVVEDSGVVNFPSPWHKERFLKEMAQQKAAA